MQETQTEALNRVLEIATEGRQHATEQANRLLGLSQERGLDSTTKWTRLREASKHYGREQAFSDIIEHCRDILNEEKINK